MNYHYNPDGFYYDLELYMAANPRTLLSSFTYKWCGSVDKLPLKGNDGEIYMCSNASIFTWVDGKWKPLGDYTESSEESELQLLAKIAPRICTQCGAPMHGNVCEYCGVEIMSMGWER